MFSVIQEAACVYESTFTMTGGTIAENEAGGDGGGVKVIGGTFAMTGGDIIGNSAEQGGGVRVYNGTFTMENGTITNNTATESGGGVLLNKSIERGYYTGIGKLTLSGGNPVICGNTAGQAADNTRFTETDLFTLAGSLGDNAEVRITSPDAKQYASFGTVSGTPNGAEHIILDEKNFTGAVNGSSLIWGDVTLHKHDGITFVPWTSSTKLPTSGNYHLVCDVTLTSHCALSGDLNLCLNGYVIRMNGKQSAFLVENGHTLNLYEDIPAKHYFTVSETNGVWNRDDSKTAGDIRLEDITSTADLTNGKVIEVTGGCITGSTEDGSGGGVYVNGGTFIMHQGNIIGNKPESGGGVYVRAGSFTMKSGSVAGNVATKSDGGGVYVSDNGKFVMDSGLIIGNSAKSNGGGVLVYNSAGKFTMNGGSIRANHANHGGGVWNGGEFLIPASTSLDVSSITGNGATSGGGVFAGAGCVFEIKDNAQITDNTADQYGGGVYVRGASITGYDKYAGNGELFMNGGKINKNLAWEDGGGVYVGEPGSNNLNGLFTMSAGSIEENTALAHGGGVYVAGGDEAFEMSGGTITKNKANSCSGYGIFIDEGTFTMTGSAVITENYTTNFAGAGVHVGGGNITIKNLTGTASAVAGIYGNKKTSDGNDVWNVDLSSYDRFTLDGILSGNTVIGITDHGRNSKPGDIFGTAADGAGGAEHIKSDTLKDRQGNPLGAIIVGTSLMWDDTETGEVPFVPVESIPDEEPTEKPTAEPTKEPAEKPTEKPTAEPTPEPTEKPGEKPYDPERTGKPPEHTPTAEPTPEPTKEPAEKPTEKPTAEPTPEPTPEPTEKPGEKPDEPGKTGKPPEYTPPAEPAEESDELLNNPSGV